MVEHQQKVETVVLRPLQGDEPVAKPTRQRGSLAQSLLGGFLANLDEDAPGPVMVSHEAQERAVGA